MKLLMLHFLRIFPTFVLYLCKNNANQLQFLPSEVKVVMKIMAPEQGLFEQLVTIHQKYYDNKKEEEKTKKYYFQGKSARSIRWIYLDHEWLEENFRACETDFYRKCIRKISG